MRPTTPPLHVDVAKPGSVQAQMHPAHTVPVVQPVVPVELISRDPGNQIEIGTDQKLFVPGGYDFEGLVAATLSI